MTIGEDGDENYLKTESFAFFNNSHFMTTEYCKARITALTLPFVYSGGHFPALCLTFHLS